VAIGEPGFLVGGSVEVKSDAVGLGPAVGDPAGRPVGPTGDPMGVVDKHPEDVLGVVGLLDDPAVDRHVAVHEFDRFVGQGDKTLNVILRGLVGVAENDDVPPLGFLKIVEELQNQHPVAAVRRNATGRNRLGQKTVRAHGRGPTIPPRKFLGADGKRVAAVRAHELRVGPVERRRHRPRRNDERLHDERAENERQNERHENRLERLQERLALLATLVRFLEVLPSRFRHSHSSFAMPGEKALTQDG